jgi:hypothetical protein
MIKLSFTRNRSLWSTALLVFAAIIVTVSSFIAIYNLTNKPADATLAGFDPGNIIEDAVMSDKDAMTVSQIQTFLNSKNPCNNTDTYKAAWYPNLRYTIRDGKFVCMAQDTFNGKSAAQIIWQAAQDYRINPQVLIVLLEKEQGLISDTWPNHIQYQTATGFGCPDTAACNTRYFGLENQIRLAANLFREVLDGGWTNYPIGSNYVLYNPDRNCGGSWINIQNRATSALYRYTPYQPNQGALNAGWGQAPCGAYGNRNFYNFFTSWFGSTRAQYTPFEEPRWMVFTKDQGRVTPGANYTENAVITKGTQLKFTSKIWADNMWYFRTAFNTDAGLNVAIPAGSLAEIPYEDFQDPRWMTVIEDTEKTNPIQEKSTGQVIKSNTNLRLVDKLYLNGSWYYRTEYDSRMSAPTVIPASAVSETTPNDFEEPRWMTTLRNTVAIDPILGRDQPISIPQNTQIFFNQKIELGASRYFRISSGIGAGFYLPDTSLSEITFSKITPIKVKLKSDQEKFSPKNGTPVYAGQSFKKDLIVDIVASVTVNGQTYYQTAFDDRASIKAGFKADSVVVL